MIRQFIISLSVASSLALVPKAAVADEPSPAVATHDTASGYSYEFTDESLLAAGDSPYGAVISSRSRFPKALLIRPRTQFIAEMLKSVESL
ncbi:MAG TPA: hypothetical protein VL137_18350 [Polyangiaceae bacterium]|nr:hypothetical protein [Polyangiaceae bacterium]